MGTQNFAFVPRSKQDEKHLSLQMELLQLSYVYQKVPVFAKAQTFSKLINLPWGILV